MTANETNPLLAGTRVTAVVYGQPRTGEVLKDQRSSVVWVRWMDRKAPAGIATWMHRESLTIAEGVQS